MTSGADTVVMWKDSSGFYRFGPSVGVTYYWDANGQNPTTTPSGSIYKFSSAYTGFTFNMGSGNDKFTIDSSVGVTTGLTFSLYGYGGNDTLWGGDGADYIDGGVGSDSLVGASGNDNILGNDDGDTIDASAGDDTVSGGGGFDLLLGGKGNDSIDGDSGEDEIYGGDGNDTISGGDDTDTLYGENGNDTVDTGDYGTSNAGGTAYGGSGDDLLYGNFYSVLIGNIGSDHLTGEQLGVGINTRGYGNAPGAGDDGSPDYASKLGYYSES